MPRSRRTLTNSDIREMVRRKHEGSPLPLGEIERRANSVAATAVFLWRAFLASLFFVLASCLHQVYGGRKEDCRDVAGAGASIECPKRGEGKRLRKRDDVGHGAIVEQPIRARYVRGGAQ